MRPYLILFFSWLVPGSGHIIQKRLLKGVLFFFGVGLLLALGLVMEGKFYDTSSFHPLLILGFLGDLGNGIFYFIIKLTGLASGNIKAMTFHYGTTYLACAGLLNYLIALNAFDIAKKRKE